MTLSEFKAWFEGFTEGMADTPDEKQWARIKARIGEIDGKAVTKTVFVDHYYPPYRRYFDGVPLWNGGQMTAMSAVGAVLDRAVDKAKSINEEFSSHCAMIDLGKAEYSASITN